MHTSYLRRRGCNVASRPFIKNLRRFAYVYGVPLILDEVQTGMGRTGNILLVASHEIDPIKPLI